MERRRFRCEKSVHGTEGFVCGWRRLCLRPRVAIGEASDLSLVTSRELHHGVLICLRRVGKLDVDESRFFVRVCLGGVGVVDRFGVRFVFCQPFLGCLTAKLGRSVPSRGGTSLASFGLPADHVEQLQVLLVRDGQHAAIRATPPLPINL